MATVASSRKGFFVIQKCTFLIATQWLGCAASAVCFFVTKKMIGSDSKHPEEEIQTYAIETVRISPFQWCWSLHILVVQKIIFFGQQKL